MVDLCLDRGINFFDTANNYNDGRSEEILGRILKGRRERVVLATKIGNDVGVPVGVSPLSRTAILHNVDASLQRLQTDYLDVYYLHRPDYRAPLVETVGALEEIVRAGKVRYLGTSNYASWQVCQSFSIAEKQGGRPPYVAQPMYNLLARAIEPEFVPFCREFGVSMVVYNPLAGGLLTGKQQRERPLPGTRFDNNPMYLDRYWHPAYFDAVDELGRIAEKAGRTVADLAFNWLLFHTATECVLLGASRIEQLEENLEVFGKGALDAETLSACDGVWERLRGVTPKYNR
jgi:aryl-alcohol dehydrogenase-like predicted oxidoreductase